MSDTSYYTYRARLKRIIDADTFELYVDQGFYDYTVKTIRLRDVDTAEVFGRPKESEEYQDGMAQMRFTEDFLSHDGDEEWPLSVKTYGPGKYGGRWLGDVWKDGQRLSKALIEEFPEVDQREE